ncbi:MAG: exosortase H [Deltaproteobacteria bacterium]|nr:exosortase H [Deltaproteobacteria bacterium]
MKIKQPQYNPTLKSAFIFITLLIIVCLCLYPLPVREKLINPFVRVICEQASYLINLFGTDVFSRDTIIIGSGFSVDVKDGCNAVYEISLFICAVLAYPSRLKYKLLGIACGSLIIYLFNLIRIVVLYMTGKYYNNIFKMVHDHVSQSLFIFLVVVLWLLWASGAKKSTITD